MKEFLTPISVTETYIEAEAGEMQVKERIIPVLSTSYLRTRKQKRATLWLMEVFLKTQVPEFKIIPPTEIKKRVKHEGAHALADKKGGYLIFFHHTLAYIPEGKRTGQQLKNIALAPQDPGILDLTIAKEVSDRTVKSPLIKERHR